MSFVLDRGLETTTGPGGGHALRPDPAYWNWIGPFGGWTAAVLMKCMLQDARTANPLMQPVSQTVDYMTGLKDDPLRIVTACDRAGRTTQFWSASLRPEGAESAAVRSTAVFGERRRTRGFVEQRMPAAPPPETLPPFRFPADRVAWPQTYDMRIVHGNITVVNETMRSLTWIRDADRRPLDFISLAAIADSCFPRIYYRIEGPAPYSTISMTTYFHADAQDLAAVGDGHVLVDAFGKRAGSGFSDQHADIWSADGQLLAVSQQMAWYDLPEQSDG